MSRWLKILKLKMLKFYKNKFKFCQISKIWNHKVQNHKSQATFINKRSRLFSLRHFLQADFR